MAVRDWAYVSFVAFVVSLGAYLNGYTYGSMNGVQNFSGYLEYFELGNSSANSSCTETSHLSENARNILGTVVSILNLGGAVGGLLAGKPADYFGRKVTLLMSGVLAVLGTCIQGTSVQGAVWMFILGRFIEGFGQGVFYAAGPLYIAEISPKHIRGALTSLIAPTIGFGLMAGYVTNLFLFDKPYGWRVSRLFGCVFSLVFTVSMSFIPRSPRWLMLKGRESEARDVLRKTAPRSKGPEGIEEELEDIRSTLDPNSESRSALRALKELLKWKNLKRLLLGFPVSLLAAICGGSVYVYSEPLFCSLGVQPFVTSLVIGGVTIIGSTIATIFVDKLGRKPLLVGGGVIMHLLAVTAGTLVYAFNLEEEYNEVVSYIVVCVVCLFMLIYSATWFNLPFVVLSEMYPLEGRAVSFAMSMTCNWLGAYIFAQAFPSILAAIQTFGSLYLLSFFDITAAVFFFFLLPETKGVSLEQVEKIFAKPWIERMFSWGPRCCQKTPSESDFLPTKTVSGHVNEVVVTEENSNDVHLHSVKQRHSFIENDKDWEDYWGRYETEVKKLGKETNV